MRVAVVGTRGLPGVHGGVERHCEELYPRLARLGMEVTVYAREGYVGAERSWNGVRVVPLPAPKSRSAEAFVHTARAILRARRDGHDLVHVHSVGPGGLVPMAKALGMPAVLTVHAPDYLQRKWGAAARAYLRGGEALGVRWADRCIAVARWMRDDLARRYGRDVAYIPNGPLRLEALPPGPALAELRLEPRRYALFAGRLIPDKRVEDLVRAGEGEGGFPIVVVGDTSHTDDYVRELRETAGDGVVFAGYRYGAELAELVANGGAFVLPSAVEGLPLSLLEAMSLGVPCVCSDIPANREVLAGLGALVPLGDVGALREAVGAALRLTADERAGVGERLRERVASEYDWDAIAEATFEVLTSVPLPRAARPKRAPTDGRERLGNGGR